MIAGIAAKLALKGGKALLKKGIGKVSKTKIGSFKKGGKRRKKSLLQRLIKAKIEGRIAREKIKTINFIR